MNRRRELLSEASSVGTSTSSLRADMLDNIRLLDLLDDEHRDLSQIDDTLSPDHQLGRLLSIRSVVSTSSSFAEQQQAALGGQHGYRLIGWGACGAVFAQDGDTLVLKLAKTDDKQLWNDYLNNTRVWEALAGISEVSDEVHVPQPHFYVPKSEAKWWEQHHNLFPVHNSAVNLPTAVLCTERIFPLPADIRTRLIHTFCSPRTQSQALKSPGNRDCLVRIYLGSRQGRVSSAFFSLRNFKLHLNQMCQLDMPTFQFAEYMAGALAAIHWSAKIDGRDIEFVLGSAPTSPLIKHLTTEELEETEPETYTRPHVARKTNFRQRMVHLWVLDFNQCQKMPMNSDGVVQAVNAFTVNDPYFPRPPFEDVEQHDIDLWKVFVVRYLYVSDKILRDTPKLRSLPREFIRTVIAHYEDKFKKKQGASTATASTDAP